LLCEDNVSLGKIVREEKILKAERGDENQYAGGHSGLAVLFTSSGCE